MFREDSYNNHLSVYKPRGMTPYGQRKQDEQRNDVSLEDAATNTAQSTERV